MDCITTSFFAMQNVKTIPWLESLGPWEACSWSLQEQVLGNTVGSALVHACPPSLKYCRAFLKYILNQLETAGPDICDSLYEEYARLMARNEEEEGDVCFKTYKISNDTRVTLQESVNLISEGTTGLCTWQAAQYLAEWAMQNGEVLHSKRILELGSGLGFTGLVICSQCCPAGYTFSDCHHQVLHRLAANIHRNMGVLACRKACRSAISEASGAQLSETTNQDRKLGGSDPEATCCLSSVASQTTDAWMPCGRGSCSGNADTGFCQQCWSQQSETQTSVQLWQLADTSVRLAQLDWERVDEAELCASLPDVDVILAADVVYDSSIIPALVRVLKCLLTNPGPQAAGSVAAYIASTVRNEATKMEFIEALDSADLIHQRLDCHIQQRFIYDRSVPIDILRITAPKIQT